MKIVCDILNERGVEYDWYVLGTAFKKETLDEIQGWFKDNKNVHFLGYKDNVYPYIKKMDYLALLTERESWGLVISEALILGIPIIVTNFEGVEYQVNNKENGIIIEMNNIDNCYEHSIDDIISLKTVLKDNVKKGNYSKEFIIDRWTKILND